MRQKMWIILILDGNCDGCIIITMKKKNGGGNSNSKIKQSECTQLKKGRKKKIAEEVDTKQVNKHHGKKQF